MNRSVPYRKAIYAEAGLRTATFIYQVEGRVTKVEKAERKYRSALAVDSLLLFTEAGYKFAVTMTVFMMLLSVSMLIYTGIVYATSRPVAGWTTTILFLSVAFLGLFGILSIVIRYLQLLIKLVFKRKQYSYESIEKLTGQ